MHRLLGSTRVGVNEAMLSSFGSRSAAFACGSKMHRRLLGASARAVAPRELLFTPGPLSTSAGVKESMLFDFGSRDAKFVSMVRDVRAGILDIAGVSAATHTAVLVQGSGTMCNESVIGSAVPREGGKLLVMANGAYGVRLGKIATTCGIETVVHETLEDAVPPLAAATALLDEAAAEGAPFTTMAIVHHETTSGILNPVQEISLAAKARGCTTILDAMSSFGAIPIDLEACGIDFLVTSANKCIEGVPGFAIAVATHDAIAQCRGIAPRSLGLDLVSQLDGLEGDGQFRFTPPVQVLAAFHTALAEYNAKGGLPAQAARYQENQRIFIEGCEGMGLVPFVQGPERSYIITSIRYPENANFDFSIFYAKLAERGFVIYPGKVTEAECFRVGHIGHIFPDDTRALIGAMRDVFGEMQIALP